MGKAMFMETTTIAPEKTVAQITQLLTQYNVAAVLLDYEHGGKVAAVSFRLSVGQNNQIPFRLPCRWQAVKAKLAAARKKATRGDTLDDWARRVAWRQVLRWLEAQLAMVDTGMVKMEEVMLPYAQLGMSGSTVYEAISGNGYQAIADKNKEG